MKRFVITANRTHDGRAVYLRADRTWSFALGEAVAVDEGPDKETLIAWARTQEAFVCDPYAAKVDQHDGALRPPTTRERIRAAGPDATLRALGY